MMVIKTESCIRGIAERLEVVVQEERDRLGQLNQDLTENLIKARADLYANVERVRSDYEQDAARLDSAGGPGRCRDATVFDQKTNIYP